jgi:PRTRC genetic system ThiF family protein
MNPSHPITIAVVGCGGTGSYVVSMLGKLATALHEIAGVEIIVEVYDDDIVEEHNVGRQLFSHSDIGKHKADVMVSRVNRFYGLEWMAITKRVNNLPKRNITITCVDNVKTRKQIHTAIRKLSEADAKSGEPFRRPFYWLDFGNSKNYGQYILGTCQSIEQPGIGAVSEELPSILARYKSLPEIKDEPSCSMMESLNQQDLFINLHLATAGIGLLWKLLREHQISYHGQFINLQSGNSRPVPI